VPEPDDEVAEADTAVSVRVETEDLTEAQRPSVRMAARVADGTNEAAAPVLPEPRTPDGATPAAAIAAARSRAGRASLPAPTGHGSTTIVSPIEALRRDEILRTRRFAVVGIVIALSGVATMPLLPGHPVTTKIMLVAIAVAVAGLLYLIHRTRDPSTFGGFGVAMTWYVPAVCVMLVVPHFGVFSPAPILLVLGTYFIGLGRSLGLATAVYLSCAAIQAGTASLIIAGVLDDPGMIGAGDLSREHQIVVQLLVQLVLGATFLIARVSRRTTLIVLGELEAAVRAVAQREAVLQEAREELERALRPGRGRFSEQTISGYKLGALIGRGAMGEVYEATAPDGGAAAVKLLSQASLGNPNHVQRFLRELRTAAAIVSPNVVKVLAVGEVPVPHLVMERLEGRDLAQILRGRRGMPVEQVVDLVRQVGVGITAAAAANVVHRDLKPPNLFCVGGTTWKILDFGVSRLTDHGDTLTSGHVVGTPAYMAPEQARGHAVDHRADLYALAAIAYRALTGYPPFSGNDLGDVLYRVVHAPPRRPGALAAIPADVDLVLAIGMAKDPRLRFATAGELADALARAIEGKLPGAIRDRARAITDPWA
jgi:serine/threonine-protein kinase